ncbi:hypothetical protein [Brucella intermedia]|uniref:hypothetical protein n=1 Tax=Brucella intermedia TaxID=94625 RepID=UPI00224B6114|nr:hypothetical protein [Brucella intermedia]
MTSVAEENSRALLLSIMKNYGADLVGAIIAISTELGRDVSVTIKTTPGSDEVDAIMNIEPKAVVQ